MRIFRNNLPTSLLEHPRFGFPLGNSLGQKHCPCPLLDRHCAFAPHLFLSQALIGVIGGHLQPNLGFPVHPASHLHSNVPTRSIHRAFFPQGFGLHLFLSRLHLTDGFPTKPVGQEHFGRWFRGLHWAFLPQTPICWHGLTQRPLLSHRRSSEQSTSVSHSALRHPPVLASLWNPLGQMQTALCPDVWQTAFGPHCRILQGSEHWPSIHACVEGHSVSLRQPVVHNPATQLSPLLQSLGLKQVCKQRPSWEHTSPHPQSDFARHDLTQNPPWQDSTAPQDVFWKGFNGGVHLRLFEKQLENGSPADPTGQLHCISWLTVSHLAQSPHGLSCWHGSRFNNEKCYSGNCQIKYTNVINSLQNWNVDIYLCIDC